MNKITIILVFFILGCKPCLKKNDHIARYWIPRNADIVVDSVTETVILNGEIIYKIKK